MAGTITSFDEFIEELRQIWSSESDPEKRMAAARPLLESLLLDEVLLEASVDWPSTEGGRNLVLYEDDDYRFMVNAVVRVPGRRGNVHDHDRQWVLYGVLDGIETLERYERLDDGTREDSAVIRLTSAPAGNRGSVDLVRPFEIHAEQGGPVRSVAVILRSERVGADMHPGRYNLETGERSTGTGPTLVPFPL